MTLPNMDLTSALSGSLRGEARRQRITLNPRQKAALQACFEQNPYPGLASREELAKEIGVPEDRIQIWFRNHRSRCLKQKSSLRSGYTSGQERDQRQHVHQERVPTETRRKRTVITRSQTTILVKAFEQNRFPGFKTREELSKQTGLPEARIQVWFQNRRARHPKESTSGCMNSLGDASNHRPHMTIEQGQRPPCMVPNQSHHLPLCNISSENQVLTPAPLFPHTPVITWDPFASCLRPTPMALVVQPSQILQAGASALAPPVLMTHLPREPPLRRGISETQAPTLHPFPRAGQDLSETTGTAVVQLKVNPPPQPEREKQQLQDMGQPDTSHSMQWCGVELQAVMADGDSHEGRLKLPGHPETQLSLQQAETAEEPWHPPSPEPQQNLEAFCLLDQLLSCPEFQAKAQAFFHPETPEQDPEPDEPALSDGEFQALLNMLQHSRGPRQ